MSAAEFDLTVYNEWLARNGDWFCTCGHPYRVHWADLSGCGDCDAYEPVHARCPGWTATKAQ